MYADVTPLCERVVIKLVYLTAVFCLIKKNSHLVSNSSTKSIIMREVKSPLHVRDIFNLSMHATEKEGYLVPSAKFQQSSGK